MYACAESPTIFPRAKPFIAFAIGLPITGESKTPAVAPAAADVFPSVKPFTIKSL